MLDSEQSLRLNLLRFPLIVGVIFIHICGTTVGVPGSALIVDQHNFITDFIENIISQGIARTAVPLFFLMSGYLFFFGLEWSKKNYLEKVKSRIKTLLVPFLFWNIVTLFLIALAQEIPATRGYFSGRNALITSFDGFDYLCAIFGIGRAPISYQFWFIRDLMLLVLLTPIIHQLNRKLPFPYLISLFVLWFLNIGQLAIPSMEATLYFSIGCFLGFHNKSLFLFDRFGKRIVVAYAAILISGVMFNSSEIYPYMQKLGIFLGVFSLLYATKFVADSRALKQAILWLASASFFVFATHEPLLTVIKKLTDKSSLSQLPGALLALYFLVPVVTITFSIFAYRCLSRISPKFSGIITGGR
jgi:surface polysaccharide O-acyltransferase-like enzyme